MTDGGRGRGAPPAGPGLRRRLGGAAVFFGGLVLVFLLLRPGPAPAPTPGRLPPFDPGVLAGVTGDEVATSFSLRGGAVLLYVDDRCPFCAQELRAWYQASHGSPPPGLKIVRRPADGVPHPGVVPAAWGPRTVVDPAGAIASALGVSAVPFVAVADGAGTVREVALGLTPRGRIHELLQILAEGQGKDPP